jgi:hypothetical protein
MIYEILKCRQDITGLGVDGFAGLQALQRCIDLRSSDHNITGLPGYKPLSKTHLSSTKYLAPLNGNCSGKYK